MFGDLDLCLIAGLVWRKCVGGVGRGSFCRCWRGRRWRLWLFFVVSEGVAFWGVRLGGKGMGREEAMMKVRRCDVI